MSYIIFVTSNALLVSTVSCGIAVRVRLHAVMSQSKECSHPLHGDCKLI